MSRIVIIYLDIQVSGIVGRAELLCALFTWLSILFYSYSIKAKKLLHRCCSMCGCISSVAIAMLCKETGIAAIVREI